MSSLNFSDQHLSHQQRTSAQDAISSLLGLELSDAEVDALLSGEALSFQKLTKSRSLSDVGTALIRADALSRSVQESSFSSLRCRRGCIRITFDGISRCICWFRKPALALGFQQLEE